MVAAAYLVRSARPSRRDAGSPILHMRREAFRAGVVMCAQPTQPEREEWKLSDESLQKHLDDPAELLAFAENLDMDIGPLFGRDVAAVVRALLAERDRLAEALPPRCPPRKPGREPMAECSNGCEIPERITGGVQQRGGEGPVDG